MIARREASVVAQPWYLSRTPDGVQKMALEVLLAALLGAYADGVSRACPLDGAGGGGP
jgi:hypothetical protein